MMIILKHPVAAHIILVPPSDAEDLTFVGHQGSTKFRDLEIVVEANLLTALLVNIIEVNVFGAPFEIMNKFPRAITLL